MNNEAYDRSWNSVGIGQLEKCFWLFLVFSMPADHAAQEDVVVYFVSSVCYCRSMKVNSRCQEFSTGPVSYEDERRRRKKKQKLNIWYHSLFPSLSRTETNLLTHSNIQPVEVCAIGARKCGRDLFNAEIDSCVSCVRDGRTYTPRIRSTHIYMNELMNEWKNSLVAHCFISFCLCFYLSGDVHVATQWTPL